MRLQPIFDIAEICFKKGIRDAVVCPGSRCAPLTLAFARHTGIHTRTISDERSAAYIGLGIAQQTKRPVVLICTSGTAAYNFAPAVAEAFYQRIPLVILTADRPVEWIGQWDGQTISQQGIYGNHVKRSYQLPQEYEHTDTRWSINRIVNEAVNLSETTQGPVHINVPLREPLYPAAGEQIGFSNDVATTDILQSKVVLTPKLIQQLATAIDENQKILIVGGQHPLSTNLIAALHAFSTTANVAVVGDVISNLHPLPNIVRYSDVFLPALSDASRNELYPDLMITLGQSVISKNLKLFLRSAKPRQHWHVGTSVDSIIDPFQSVSTMIALEPEDFFSLLLKNLKSDQRDSDYSGKWLAAESKAGRSIVDYFGSEQNGELAFVHKAMKVVPDHSCLHLANSMSVRYANFAGLSDSRKGVEVFSNRGTSGIDGCTSTAVGHSLSTSAINTLISGDVAFFYDRNAFWNKYDVPNLRVIVINNHGGAIFGVIDGPGATPEGQEYFITEQRLSAKNLAEEFNIEYIRVDDNSDHQHILTEFYKTGDRPKILEYETSSDDARKLFLRFKEKIKNTYAA